MEPGTDLQQRSHSPAGSGNAARWFRDARQDLQQGRLAGPVAADESHGLPLLDRQCEIAQRADLGVGLASVTTANRRDERLAQSAVSAGLAEPIRLAQLPNVQGQLGHQILSAKRRSTRPK